MKESHSDNSTWNDDDFHAFIKENAAVFNVFAGRYIKDEDTVNDILQESFLKFWTSREKPRSPRSYLFTIIRNTIFDHLEHVLKERPVDLSIDYGHFSDDETFFRNIVEAESADRIARAIKSLSPQSRQVILMTMEGKKIKHISEALGISTNTVKTIKYRALERLSKLLSREDMLLVLLIAGVAAN